MTKRNLTGWMPRWLVLAGTLLSLSAAAQHLAQLQPFSTDGCSMFMDGPVWAPNRWRHCCVAHDLAYWQGGTQAQRLAADQALRACVARAQDDFTADTMYAGVRWGGHPDWPVSYRWGYGWGLVSADAPGVKALQGLAVGDLALGDLAQGNVGLLGYAALTPAEQAQVDALMPQALALMAEDARRQPPHSATPEQSPGQPAVTGELEAR